MQHYWQLGSVRLWTAHAKKGRSLNCGRNIYNQFPAYTARWNFYQIHENDECTEIAPLAPCCSRVARSGLWRPLEATHLICPPPTNKQSMQTESDVICRLWAKASTAARALDANRLQVVTQHGSSVEYVPTGNSNQVTPSCLVQESVLHWMWVETRG
jgi:hypothetical protein